MSNVLFNLLEVLIVLVPMLLAIAFMTIIERKQLAAMQRRVGPNTVGIFGILQPFYLIITDTKVNR
jgi:NADH-ubiquinone oxidoreductase chain 1